MFLTTNKLLIFILWRYTNCIEQNGSTEDVIPADSTQVQPEMTSPRVTTDPYSLQHPHDVTLDIAKPYKLNISWHAPLDTSDGIEHYVVYHTSGSASDGQGSSTVSNASTHYTISGLSPGSMYTVCVEAVWITGTQTRSHSHQFITAGFGGDANPCDCNPQVSTGACDVWTGDCVCRNDTMAGPKCQQCAEKYFKHGQLGCENCHCPEHKSNGSCYLNGDIKMCHCVKNFRGPECGSCNQGYFSKQGTCLPCHCSNNTDPSLPQVQCTSDTGVCSKCWYNTTGPACDKCKDGFTGSALDKTCTPISKTHHHRQDESPSLGAGAIAAIGLIVGGLLITATVLVIYYNYKKRGHKPALWSVQLHDEDVNFSQMMEGQDLEDDPFGRKLEQTEQRLHLNMNGADREYQAVRT